MGADDMLVVSGRLFLAPGTRKEFLQASREAMASARIAPGCLDFVVAADPIDPDRVNVYEEWDTAADLETFRGEGPGPALGAVIIRAEVSRHQIASSAPA
jgi:quinol monooxygenase YgiN